MVAGCRSMPVVNISVVIPAINEEAVLGRAIASAWRAAATEVIVVDGGSQDDTPQIAEALRCRVLAAPAGRARQQNAGAAAATGEALLFLHADNWLSETALIQIGRALEDPATVGGSFRQAIAAPGVHFRLLEWGNGLRARWLGMPYGDQGLFVRRSVFDAVGGFAPVPLMEDVLLMRVLRRQGRLAFLSGPLQVDARRWQQAGLVRQTLRNWLLLAAFRLGVSPARLARFYPRHDRPAVSPKSF